MWLSTDPLAEQNVQIDKSPFAYTWNNPINLTDPDGMSPYKEMEDDRYTIYGKDGSALVSSFGGGNARSNTTADVHIARYKDGTVRVISSEEYNKFVEGGVKEEGFGEFFVSPESDIKAYEANEKRIRDNSIIVDAISSLTSTGQLEGTLSGIYDEWQIMTQHSDNIKISSQDIILSRAKSLLTGAGITVTTKAPYVQLAATAITIKLGAENVYLQSVNNAYYIPKIRRESPNYARLNIPGSKGYGDYVNGGAGAGGGW